MGFLRLSGRLILNVHTANAEGAVGNYMGLSKMFIVRRTPEGFDFVEEPVVSGNMVKHWHAVAFVELLKSWGYNGLCDNCRRHVMYRSTLNLTDEIDYIKKCAIEDVHGFLDAGTQIRRESLAKFSFLIPIEEERTEYEAVTHNRVVVNEKGAVPKEEQQMMVMKREHASGVYGFACTMDLAFVGRSLSNPTKEIEDRERKVRAKAAVLALGNLFSGQVGAAQARALPIIRCIEAVCAVAQKPLPNLVHGFYADYIEETARILATFQKDYASDQETKIIAVGDKPTSILESAGLKVEKARSLIEAVSRAAEEAPKWI